MKTTYQQTLLAAAPHGRGGYYEYAAEDRFQGTTFGLSIVKKF